MDDAQDDGLEIELDDGFRFAQVPEDLLFSRTSGNAVKVYGALLRHGQNPQNCRPSLARVARLTYLSKATVVRAVAELEAAGWLAKVARTRVVEGSGKRARTSNGYRLHSSPRPGQVGPRADQGAGQVGPPVDQGGSQTDQGGPPVTTLNESKKNESKGNDTPAAPLPSVPSLNLLGEREARRSAPGAQTRQEKNFAAFWRAYPEPQCSEPEARRLFTAATRRARAADIQAGLDRWAAHWAEHGYPMGAVRWLKGDYWAEPVPTVKAKPGRFPEPPPPEYLFKPKPEPIPEASAEDKADTRARQARQRIIRQKSQAARARGDLDESRRLFRLNLDTWAEPLSVTAEDILARPAAEPEPVSA